jgi:uncharacterized integral membrane protein
MRQLNFVMIFVVCLGFVIFGLENTQLVTIKFFGVKDVQAPLCVELILAMGIGAVVAWFFHLWNKWQVLVQSQETIVQNQEKEVRIQELEQDVERYKAEIQQYRLPPASSSLSSEKETIEVMAQ